MIVPPGLGETGSAIYLSKAAGVSDPAALALIKEAARCADRLDDLDEVIQGKGVLDLLMARVLHDDIHKNGDHHMHIKLSFGSTIAEARQQQLRLTTLLNAVSLIAPAATPALPAEEKPVEAEKPGTGLSELEAHRARRAAARGK